MIMETFHWLVNLAKPATHPHGKNRAYLPSRGPEFSGDGNGNLYDSDVFAKRFNTAFPKSLIGC